MRDLFTYVEFTRTIPDTEGKKTKWQRIRLAELAGIREQVKNYGLYITIQQWKNDVGIDNELQWAPIYFDLDFKEDVSVALLECQKVVEYFYQQFGLGKEHVRVWFSGSKGFHIVITPELFGIQPHQDLSYIIRNACSYVAAFLELKSFDRSVYSIKRMWRLHDSVHEKTSLYCVELTHEELYTKDIDEIRTMAMKPRGELYEASEYERVEPNPLAEIWFMKFKEEYERQKELSNLTPKKPIKLIQGEDPVCITDVITNSIRKSGTRNQAEMALASYYKDTGRTTQETIKLVSDWAKKVPKNLTTVHNERNLEANVRSVVDTVYSKNGKDSQYHFSCAFIRALGSGTDKPIACLHDACKFIHQDDQEPEKPIALPLFEASRAVYIGKRITTKIMVAGKDEAPYGIPAKTEVTCKPDLGRENSICTSCGIVGSGGSHVLVFTAKNQLLLSLLDTSTIQQRQILRKTMGIPERCNKHLLKVLEYGNVIEVLAIPRLDFRPETINEEAEYVYRKCFFVGHDLTTNKEYEVSGYTWPEPKTQHLVHVLDSAVPLTDDVAMFNPEQTTLDSLVKFQISEMALVKEREK